MQIEYYYEYHDEISLVIRKFKTLKALNNFICKYIENKYQKVIHEANILYSTINTNTECVYSGTIKGQAVSIKLEDVPIRIGTLYTTENCNSMRS